MKWRLAIWLGLVLACLAVISGTRFTADMSAFLPASPTAAQQLLVDQLRHGPVARLLLLAIEGSPETAPQRAHLSRTLATRLTDSGHFATVSNGAQLPGGDATGPCCSGTATCWATRSMPGASRRRD